MNTVMTFWERMGQDEGLRDNWDEQTRTNAEVAKSEMRARKTVAIYMFVTWLRTGRR